MAWRKLIEVAAATALAPVILLLVAGRLVFFWAVDVLMAVRRAVLEVRDMPMPRQALATLLPFWAAWFLAVLLLAGGFAGAILVVNGTESGPLTQQFATRVLVLVAAGAIFYLALRLALFGTAAMQRAMAHNLALLISSELAELNAEAERSAKILAAGGCPPALHMPRFGDEREDIARLFGHPTQSALERLLRCLEAFNSTAIRHEEDFAAMLMREQIQEVQVRLALAIATIGPFCTRGLSQTRLRSC
jgi:hypothetical protein